MQPEIIHTNITEEALRLHEKGILSGRKFWIELGDGNKQHFYLSKTEKLADGNITVETSHPSLFKKLVIYSQTWDIVPA